MAGVQRPGPVCFVARGVNLKNTGYTDITGSPLGSGGGLLRKTSQRFAVTQAWVVIKTLTGTLTGAPSISIDGSSKSTGSVTGVSVVANVSLGTALVLDSQVDLTLVAARRVCDIGSASGSLGVTVNTGATVTTLTADVWIEGVYV